MTGNDLYQLTESIMGYAPDQTLFYTLLAMVQGIRENQRPWMILKKEDASNTVNQTSQSAFLTPFNLPADFRKFYSPKRSVQLVDASNTIFQWYVQVPKDRKFENKDDNTKFYCDFTSTPSKIYLCGIVNQLYTMHIYYQYQTPIVTATTSWVFPSEYHPILAYDVAALIKAGIDSDVVNASQAISNNQTSNLIFEQMKSWDDELANTEVEGVEYYDINGERGFISRTIPNTNGSN